MTNLVVAAVVWVISHLGISSTKLRPALVARLGEWGYICIYSLIAVAAFAYLIWSYSCLGVSEYLWNPTLVLRWVALLLMPIALIFVVGSLVTANPTIVGQSGKLAGIGSGSGMIRITRHPFQWGVVMWAAAHVLAKGDVGSLVFFGAFGSVSLLGTVLMDRKKSAQLGADWTSFSNVTSNIPFAAIIKGRNRFCLDELWLPISIGLSAYALLLWWGHKFISGVAIL
ncbi:MAG: NnrU family protein [Pseudomonadales bacterium]